MKKQANTGVCFQIFCFLRVFIPVKTERLSSGPFPRAVTSAVPLSPPPIAWFTAFAAGVTALSHACCVYCSPSL